MMKLQIFTIKKYQRQVLIILAKHVITIDSALKKYENYHLQVFQ